MCVAGKWRYGATLVAEINTIPRKTSEGGHQQLMVPGQHTAVHTLPAGSQQLICCLFLCDFVQSAVQISLPDTQGACLLELYLQTDSCLR